MSTRASFAAAPLLLLALLVAAPLAAQGSGPPPEIATAQSQLAAGDAKAAVATLETLFAKQPQPPPTAQLLFGDALRQAGQIDRALAAYLAVPPQARVVHAQGLFRAAILEAARGRREQALGLVEKLGAGGVFDMDLLREAPELAPFQTDPRFAAAMFSPDDFAEPFVEKVKVIHQWQGEAKGDQFSWIARSIPDVDGDGVREIVTSAPTQGASGQTPGPGRVYLYSGRSGKLEWAVTGEAGEALGTGLEGAGDVDRDGAADVVAGAPGTQRAYVLSGRDGRRLRTLVPPQADAGFGQSASGVGDQNGDGHADVAVGAPGGPPSAGAPAAPAKGRAYVFSGKDGSLLLTLEGDRDGDSFGSIVSGAAGPRGNFLVVGAPSAGPRSTGRVYVYRGLSKETHFLIDSDETGAALGAMFVSVVGDIDADGTADVYASDFANAAKGPSTGRVYVHSGRDGRRLLTLTGETARDAFGVGSADVGDLDRDGHDDLVLGAWQHASAAPSGGKIYVFSGKDGRLLRSFTGRVPGETLGFDAAGAGDVDGDGVVDLLVTSSWSNVKGFRSGRMYVISGR